MGLEPTPGPWQGPVLPLYYGRPKQENSNTTALRRQGRRKVGEDCRDFQRQHRVSDDPVKKPKLNWATSLPDLQHPAPSLPLVTSADARQIWRL